MSEEKPKSKAIPTRHDADVVEMIERIAAATGVSKSEIIRRAVRYTLIEAQKTGSLNFLIGDQTAIDRALDPRHQALARIEEQHPFHYPEQSSETLKAAEPPPESTRAPRDTRTQTRDVETVTPGESTLPHKKKGTA